VAGERPGRILPAIVFSQLAGASLWFSGNALLPDLQEALGLPADALAGVTSAVQLGFIAGTLVARRPDVRAAEQALVAANARIGYVKAARFPTFTLTGAIGTESKAFAGLFEADTATSTLGLELRYPLLDYGRGAARVEAAVAAQHQAAATYEKVALNAFREVRDALADVRETAAAAAAAARREQAAREAFRVASARRAQGQADPLEFQQARRTLAESQVAVARVRLDRLGAQVDLIKALGGAEVAPPASR